jgi:hypothetical protein
VDFPRRAQLAFSVAGQDFRLYRVTALPDAFVPPDPRNRLRSLVQSDIIAQSRAPPRLLGSDIFIRSIYIYFAFLFLSTTALFIYLQLNILLVVRVCIGFVMC